MNQGGKINRRENRVFRAPPLELDRRGKREGGRILGCVRENIDEQPGEEDCY